MKTLLLIVCSYCTLACTEKSESVDMASTAKKEESLYERAWVFKSSHMGIAIALDEDRYMYHYWFYSDVNSGDEPSYPLKGYYDIDGNTIKLYDTSRNLYWTSWEIFDQDEKELLQPMMGEKKAPYFLRKVTDFDPNDPFGS